MIDDSNKYYLYRHVRLDKNEVFYIGIGTKYAKSDKYYKRSQKRYGRNKFWKNIANKTKYIIDILIESNDYKFIQEKEKEFIKLYGRRDKNQGTLVNLTDGGDVPIGYITRPETIEKLRLANLGKKYSQSTKDKVSQCSKRMWKERRERGEIEEFMKGIDNKRSIKIDQYDKNMNFIKTWNCISDAMRAFNVNSTSNFVSCCKNKRKSAYGYIWKYH